MKKMNIYTIATITFLAVMLSAGGYLLYRNNAPSGMKHYTHATHELSFDYPAHYALTETPMDNAPGTRITITDKDFRTPENGEGPTAITVDIFDTPTATSTKGKSFAESWITSSPSSNFVLSDMKVPGPTRIADAPAWLYTWDGLYRGISVVTEQNGSIFMFSVTYDGEADLEKREVFTNMMESVRFEKASTSTPAGSN